jgi:hypothetical protein
LLPTFTSCPLSLISQSHTGHFGVAIAALPPGPDAIRHAANVAAVPSRWHPSGDRKSRLSSSCSVRSIERTIAPGGIPMAGRRIRGGTLS